jgi:hypothetical protein
VQTDQPHQDRYPFPAGTATGQAYRHAAAEYVALFPTRLALARWTRGGDIPHVFGAIRSAPLRAAWYAQAQSNFQSWLEGGGFHAE